MKKLLCVLLSVILFALALPTALADLMLQYDGNTVNYTGAIYDLTYNGESLKMPLAPIIFNDRALVPVRELFEAAGASVSYIEQNNKQIVISKDDLTVSMHINDNTAYVNNTKVNIPDGIAPKLINKVGESAKTMVPVRFISETIGLNVDFDGEHGIINISSKNYATQTPTPTSTPTVKTGVNITKVTFSEMSQGQLIATFTLSDVLDDFDAFVLTNPSRLVIDVPNANTTLGDTMAVTKGGVKSIRIGDTDERIRIVFDANDVYKYEVSTTTDKKLKVNILTKSVVEAVVSFGQVVKTKTESLKALPVATRGPDTLPTPTPKPSTTVAPTYASTPTPTATPIPTPRPTIPAKKPSEYIVVIDAGHGGTDSGAVGTLDGESVLEKNLNLTLSYQVKAKLEASGINVKLSRPEDKFVELAPRPYYANDIEAVLFVSIHINSAENKDAYGIETYYADENNGSEYTLTSKQLATILLNHLIKETGATNRGVKQAAHAVTRRCLMPASLVEVGFISNDSEVAKLNSAIYQNKIATAISDGIVEALAQLKWK